VNNYKHFAVLFVAVLLALFMAGCAATESQRSFGETVDDSVITSKVKTALFNEPSLSGFEVRVKTYQGRVQLSGFVSSREDIDKAIEIASGVEGVRSVENDMQLK